MPERPSMSDRVGLIAAMAEKAPKGPLNRTAVMKCAYLLQTVRGVPLGYHFTLYSYGPYDSDVLEDLDYAEMLRAVEVKRIQYVGGYGYNIRPGAASDRAKQKAAAFLAKYRDHIDWVVRDFGGRTSAELELASTIIYADREAAQASETLAELGRRVRDVKPHFDERQILEEARSLQDKDLLKSIRPAGE